MSRIKTATTALTAALLVTGIGLAVAQTDDQQQPADPMAAATAATPTTTSEQTPADPNALPPVDNTTQMPQQTPPANDPAQTTPPANSSYPSTDTTTAPSSSGASYEPAPRADRN